jgi:small GTP-binding protein
MTKYITQILSNISVNNETYTIQIWDTAGQERFKSLRTPFYRGADCCLLTFGLDDLQSFRNLAMWKKEFLYYADVQDPEHFPFVVLGNKCDVAERLVSEEEARNWCRANGLVPFFKTSAKDAINVDAAFVEAVRQVAIQESKLDMRSGVMTVNLGQGHRRNPQRNNSCC